MTISRACVWHIWNSDTVWLCLTNSLKFANLLKCSRDFLFVFLFHLSLSLGLVRDWIFCLLCVFLSLGRQRFEMCDWHLFIPKMLKCFCLSFLRIIYGISAFWVIYLIIFNYWELCANININIFLFDSASRLWRRKIQDKKAPPCWNKKMINELNNSKLYLAVQRKQYHILFNSCNVPALVNVSYW